MKRMILLGLALMALIGLASAGTTGEWNMSLTVGNELPTIIYVYNIDAQNPTQNAATSVSCTFIAIDGNGYTDLDIGGADCLFQHGIESEGKSSTCSETMVNATSANFTCSVNMQYYDSPGVWIVNATINDTASARAYNDYSVNMTYNSLTAMGISPTSINFGTVTPGQVLGAADDPLVVYNQGNTNLSQVKITAYDLIGASNPAYTIPANSFNVSSIDAAGGDLLQNSTAITVSGVSVPKGSGASDDVFLWLAVPSPLYKQTYTTPTSWVVSVFT